MPAVTFMFYALRVRARWEIFSRRNARPATAVEFLNSGRDRALQAL